MQSLGALDFIVFLACFATLCHAGSLSRYDWHDDGSSAGGEPTEVYRSLTSEKAALDSLALSTLGRDDDDDRYESVGDTKTGSADDNDGEKREGSLGFSVDNLSDEKRRLLTEILSSVYDDDGQGLDGYGFSKASSESNDDHEDDDDDKSSNDRAEEIIADILSRGSSSVNGPAKGISALDLAYRQYQKAVRMFAVAETEALEAQLAFSEAESMVATAASDAVAKASETARSAAVSSIATARSEAKSSVLVSRQKYVSSVVDAHAKIALMKTAERRFKTLLRIFAKARAYAGASILGVKRCRKALIDAKSKRTSYDDYTRAYNTAVATAKTRVGKMKVVEKRVLLMAKALAKARAEGFTCKMKVRKMGFSCAKTCAMASVKVRDAISAATKSISQAIDLATATASVKAESVLEAASQSKAKGEDDLQSAKLAMAEAKAQVEAISDGSTTAATALGASSDEDDSMTGVGDDDSYPTSLDSLSGAPAISNAQVAAQSSVSSGAGTDATDTKAYY